ncbi:Hypothetical protein, putative [Bodo saltans]|uniref:EF-hand domain-containing protein n=1 Tax=Bodo saltans TaxID=75058 RepID=A0A0S4JA67_BODSA|nr:Hypothetical protein, putative [Bodo saltans]|eukprot:CUG87102.1 Hypothetical protein, putative [Bodo saltans]
MTFGSPTTTFDPHDPFVVVNAMKSTHIATKRMAQETRERVTQEGRANAEWRRQQQQALHNSNRRLHKMKGDTQLIKSTAPPSAAAQFDVAIKDPRTPRPQLAPTFQVSQHLTRFSGARCNRGSRVLGRGGVGTSHVVGTSSPRDQMSLMNSMRSAGGILVNSGTQIAIPHAAISPHSHRGAGSRGGPFGATVTSGVGGGTCGTLVPLHDGSGHLSLPAIDRISPRIINNAESDFTVLSYGHTHAHAALFKELPEEYVFDLSGRRVPVVQFLKYFERTGQDTLSFPQYVHLVYSHPMEDTILAVRHFSSMYGWAANLSESIAKMVATLWLRWTEDGDIPFTMERFMEMHHAHPRNARRYAELEVIFRASDHNDDGVFDKDEFAAFFSGGQTAGDGNDSAGSSPRGDRRRVSSPQNKRKSMGSMRSSR